MSIYTHDSNKSIRQMFIFACIIYKAGPQKKMPWKTSRFFRWLGGLLDIFWFWTSAHHWALAVGSLGKFHGWGKHHAKLAASRPWQLKLCHLGLSARREVGIHLYQPTNQYKQWIQEPWDLSTAINNNKYKPMELTIQNTHHFYSGIPCSIFECRQNVLQHLSMKSMAEIWTGWVPHLGRKHGRAHCVFVWERWE